MNMVKISMSTDKYSNKLKKGPFQLLDEYIQKYSHLYHIWTMT